MPPKKKYILSTTIRWSAFEVDLFRYLSTITNRSMAEDMRTAVRFYARNLPGFDAEEFGEFMRKSSIAEAGRGAERERLTMELDAFIQSCKEGRNDVLDHTLSPQDLNFNSSARDFDLD